MSDDRDRAIATATATSEETPYGAHKLADVAEKTPVTRVVRAGTEIRTVTGAA